VHLLPIQRLLNRSVQFQPSAVVERQRPLNRSVQFQLSAVVERQRLSNGRVAAFSPSVLCALLAHPRSRLQQLTVPAM
jgi:hypothetical protein